MNGSTDGLLVKHVKFDDARAAGMYGLRGAGRSEGEPVNGRRRNLFVLHPAPRQRPVVMPRHLRERRLRRGRGGINREGGKENCGAQHASYQPEFPFFSRLPSRFRNYTAQRRNDETVGRAF